LYRPDLFVLALYPGVSDLEDISADK
jgi:hypothetical protein